MEPTKIVLVAVFAIASPAILNGQLPVVGPSAMGNLGLTVLYDPASDLLRTAGAGTGAYVDRIIEGGPAERAGLQQGDLIVGAGMTKVTDGREFNDLFRSNTLQPGQEVTLIYLRNGKQFKATVAVEAATSVFPELEVPFSAEDVRDRTWNENNVLRHTHEEAMIYRDSSGRAAIVRTSRNFAGVAYRKIQFRDPFTGVNAFVDEGRQTALLIGSILPRNYHFPRAPSLYKWADQPSQYLGEKDIEGLNCEGYLYRKRLLNPQVAGLSVQSPVEFNSERWISTLTPWPVLEIDKDPLNGKQEARLVNVHLGEEPPEDLFRIPTTYRITRRNLAEDLQRDAVLPKH